MSRNKVEGRDKSEQPMDSDGDVQNNYYKVQDEVAISLQQKCVLHICGQGSKQTVALGLSDYSIALYDVCSLKHIHDFSDHMNTITDVKFASSNEHLLYSSSLDGTVKVHDLRYKKLAFELKDDSEGLAKLKPLTSFDFSSDEIFASAGTEVVDGDAFILFFDIRREKVLGGYWETHTDDVTQVRFHPEARNVLATGSTDGLINVFDITKYKEDDALTNCLNTESSVDKLCWFQVGYNKFNLSCITHTEEIQLWEHEDASPFAHFSREDIGRFLQDDTVENTYIVNTLSQTDDDLLIMAGCSSEDRTALQVLSLRKNDMKKVHTISHLNGNKQTVRSSWYYKEDEILLTGGEGGILSLWKPCSREDLESDGSQLKHSKIKQRTKAKPYQRE